jgi:hypothetical protein
MTHFRIKFVGCLKGDSQPSGQHERTVTATDFDAAKLALLDDFESIEMVISVEELCYRCGLPEELYGGVCHTCATTLVGGRYLA